jgi:DNA polymerase-2
MKHCLPTIVEQVWQGRETAKRERNAPLSQALKIIMNAFYGVLGSSGCRFFDPRLASSITLRGHDIMHRTRELITEQGYQVIYGDTDSTFVWLKTAHTDEEAGKIGRALVKHVNAWWARTSARGIRPGERAGAGIRDALTRRFLMPTIRGAEEGSKKRYAGPGGASGDGSEEMVYKGPGNGAQRLDAAGPAIPAGALPAHLPAPAAYQDYVRDYVAAHRARRIRRCLLGLPQAPAPPGRTTTSATCRPTCARRALADAYNLAAGAGRVQYQRGGWISYVITVAAARSRWRRSAQAPIDYDHYVTRQLQPVADAICRL